ncbi:hypothetical protein [Helicobacter cetorum]|uniref:hypothetical protein n=1 Tax=Helicobacter cetorum TaxID=138563 RepID=UPI0013155156|nr:hypothetical protein [Helicobacter cetorum]
MPLIDKIILILKDKEMYKDNEELAKEYMRQQTKRTLLRTIALVFCVVFVSSVLSLTAAYIFRGF